MDNQANISTGEERRDPPPDGGGDPLTMPSAPAAEPEKTTLTGFRFTIEVMICGDQDALEIEQSPQAAQKAMDFLNEMRARNDVRLINIGKQKFVTTTLPPQP